MRLKREKQEALDDLHWKDERGPSSRQSGERRKCFKKNVGETFQRCGGAHMGFSERVDTILNWNELDWTMWGASVGMGNKVGYRGVGW